MQSILWDIARADALSQEIIKKDSTKKQEEEKIKLTEKIFLIHDVSKAEFDKSYIFYVKHPDMLKTMLDSINTQQTRLSAIPPDTTSGVKVDTPVISQPVDTITKVIPVEKTKKKLLLDTIIKYRPR
jgi:hypothetical protein